MIKKNTNQSYAALLDQEDPLAHFRDHFHLPMDDEQQPMVYFTGNSLGLQPKTVHGYIEHELSDWAKLGVDGHFKARNPWFSYHEAFREGLAKLVGGKETEVVAMNGLTVNLHVLMSTFYRPTPERYKIIMLQNAFPSDHYAVASQVRMHGFDPSEAIVYIGAPASQRTLDMQELSDALDQEGHQTALILIEGVSYLTGQRFDLSAIATKAKAHGVCIGADLAHAVGNVPLQLHEDQVDFAVWCNYKYVNGGPGCVGGAFVHERHVKKDDLFQLAGWWGHDQSTRFQMDKTFVPMRSADRFQMSNAPVMNMVGLRASLEIFNQAGMDQLRAKSLQMIAYMQMLLQEKLGDALTQITPLDPEQRGAQFSLIVPGGKEVFEALQKQNIVCDWREPNVLRLAPVPLYNQFQEIWTFVDVLQKAMS
jgi:kynureninase